MQRTLIVVLCLAAAVFQVGAAGAPFVTAGFPITPVPFAFPAPESMWSNAPVGQEFVSLLPKIEFVDVTFNGGGAAHNHVVLHEQTITGPVVGISQPTNGFRFTFSPPATVSPGATYVLEFVRLEPITNENDAPLIYRSPFDYPSGRRIWRGIADANHDLYFRAGVFVPSMFSTNAPAVIADGVARPFDPHATFANPYVTNFDGATLTWAHSLYWSRGEISLASGGSAEISIVAETGDIFYNGGAISFGHVLTNGGISGPITVQFNANADANAVGAVMRSLLYAVPARVIVPSPAAPAAPAAPLPPPSSSLVIIVLPPRPISYGFQITFRHPLGEVFESRLFTPNTPPAPYILISGGGAFLDSEHVVITRRQETTASVQLSVFGSDSDGDLVTFAWWLPPDTNIVSTLPRLTNDFALGPHTVSVIASDSTASTTAEASFETITPSEAIARLRADLTEKFAGNPPRGLERVLRFAARAIETQQWNLAARELEVFRNRLGRLVEDEALRFRWYRAAGDVRDAVRRQPRFVVIQPRGIFPGPVTPVPERF